MLHSTPSTSKKDLPEHPSPLNGTAWVKGDPDQDSPHDSLIKQESFTNGNNTHNNDNDDDNSSSGIQFLNPSFFSQSIHAQKETFPQRFRESVSSTSSSDSFAACTSPKSMSSATSHSSAAQSIQDYRWREPNHHEHKLAMDTDTNYKNDMNDINDINSRLEQQASSSKMPIKDDTMMMLDATASSAAQATIENENYSAATSSAALLIHHHEPPDASQPLQIRILGVPDNGAKSRVETQIKLCIQLVTDNGTKVPLASHLRLPERMLARAKLRKSLTKKNNTPGIQSAKDPVIDLDAAVVCVSDPSRAVRMCAGCVRRERKRAERKKDCGPISTSDEAFEHERDRVLIFNCDPLLNFSSSDAILPTRITCYCRHHNERVGFRIRFTMRLNGALVATGETPPIMITDDHKSIKQPTNRKRRRGEDSLPAHTVPVTPVSSRRGSMCTQNADPSPLHHHHHQPQLQHQQQQPSIQPTVPSHGPLFGLPDYTISSTTTTPLPTPVEEHAFNVFEDGNNGLALPAWPGNDSNTVSNDVGQPFPSSLPASSSSSPFSGSLDAMSYRNSMMIPHLPHPSVIPQSLPVQPQPQPQQPQPQPQPRVSRLVPAQGPTYGGVEITILGCNFYRGLTCLFGDRPATTLCWSPSTLVCVLPPAMQAGPVVVSFKEHPLLVEGTDVTLFHYYDTNDQALLELALQVVGLKMTGKLHDAKQVAMGIVQGNQNNTTSEGKPVVVPSQQLQLQQKADKETTVLEERVVRALRATGVRDVSAANATGHTLLHLAVMCCYRTLVQVLLQLGAPVDAQDRNGLTPLHLACTKGFGAIADMLITASGGQMHAQSRFCDDMVIQSKRHPPSTALLRRFHSLQNLTEAHVSADDGVDDDEPNVSLKKTQQMDQEGLGLQERHKLDKRLYLFWLPLLLVTIGFLVYQVRGHVSMALLQQHYRRPSLFAS